MKRFLVFLCAIAVGILLLASPSLGTPLFGLHTADDFQQALNDNRITAVSPDDPVLLAKANLLSDETGMPVTTKESTLSVLSNFEGKPGLLMEWEGVENEYALAAWQYNYTLDPDLTGTILQFTIYPPIESMYVSLALIDDQDRMKIWDWHAGTTLNAGEDNLVTLNPAGDRQGADSWLMDADFDISSVVAIQFDEAGIWSDQFPISPSGSTLVWNVWDDVQVVPEFCTMLLLGTGLAGFVGFRKKFRKV
jgi:hypothetical protein